MEKFNVVRPDKLSDPFFDFNKDELEAIIKKNDDALTGTDFQYIFQTNLPAGEYQECLYFVPVFLNFLSTKVKNHDGSSIVDALDDFLWWYEHYNTTLEKNGYISIIQESLNDIFRSMIEEFYLIHKKDGRIFPGNNCIMESFVKKIINNNLFFFLKITLDDIYSKKLSYSEAAWLVDICIYSHETYNADWRVSSFSLFDRKQKKDAIEMIFLHIINTKDDFPKNFWIQRFIEIIS